MALFKGKLFAGALFAGALLAGASETPSQVVSPPSSGAGGGRVTHIANAPAAPEEYNEAVRRSRIQQEDEELMLLVSTLLKVMV